MADWHPIQHSFSAGEVSERMLMRTDSAVYAQSVLDMLNFIPTL